VILYGRWPAALLAGLKAELSSAFPHTGHRSRNYPFGFRAPLCALFCRRFLRGLLCGNKRS